MAKKEICKWCGVYQNENCLGRSHEDKTDCLLAGLILLNMEIIDLKKGLAKKGFK